jgi:hypothetical protein
MESTTEVRQDAPAAKAANKPVKIFRHHGISVSVFANPVKFEGRERVFFKITMSKAYRDEEGKLQRTGSFDASEVPVLGTLLNIAFEAVVNQQLHVGDRESEE